MLVFGSAAALTWARRRGRKLAAHAPNAARRYASRLSRSFASESSRPDQKAGSALAPSEGADGSLPGGRGAARRVSMGLIRYLELGTGRPPGALTPPEAQQGVARLTYSEDLGHRADQLARLCDLALYGDPRASPSGRELMMEARSLFKALGQVSTSRRPAR